MKKHKILKAFSILAVYMCVSFFPSCMPGNPSEEEFSQIGVSGVLLSAGPASSPLHAKSGEFSGTPLAGYQLYCVTTTEPTIEGSGFADAYGKVALVLRVKSASFACSVLNPSGTTVASLFFLDAAGTRQGRIIAASADVNLGTISVNSETRAAKATIPSNATIVASNPPETIITSGPQNPTTSQTATFQFKCFEAGCTFECSLDSGAWQTCASPKNYASLSFNSHILKVRAKNASGMVDPTPANYAWTISAAAPLDTFITSGPPSPSFSQDAVFQFNCNQAICYFECSLDSSAWLPCVSPKVYTGLSYSSHNFKVRAQNEFGFIDSTPASYSWAIRMHDSWESTTLTGAPSARAWHRGVWTGTEMIVWGGSPDNINFLNTGGIYNPITDSWHATSTTNAPSPRNSPAMVWTTTEVIIWGGNDASSVFSSGGRYDPRTDSWISISTINAPSARTAHAGVWTGTEMLVWGGRDTSLIYFNTGGRYNPLTDSWVATSIVNAPEGRDARPTVWTGTELIIWGGYNKTEFFNTGGRYNPNTDTWITMTTTNAPSERGNHVIVWTGTEALVWGGDDGILYFNSGGRYNPQTDSWAATTITNAPPEGTFATGIWTGTEMIVWGGFDGDFFINTGGRYNPTSDTWVTITITNAPPGCDHPVSFWVGTEMIVWGGSNGTTSQNTGGIYVP